MEGNPDTMTLEKPWTTSEFARALGVTLKTFNRIRGRAHAGKFPRPLNPGDRYLLWPAEPCRNFIRTGKV